MWYARAGMPHVIERVGHIVDVVAARRPPVVLPNRSADGIWNVPGSMLYFPMHGRRRLIPLSVRVRRAHKGLDRAARERRIFHLWFHPTNLADETERMFAGLRRILERARELGEGGDLVNAPMMSLVPAPGVVPDGR